MEDIVLDVNGMTCQCCEERIRTALERLPGIRKVTAHHDRGGVRVALDPKRNSRAHAREAIGRAGYEVAS